MRRGLHWAAGGDQDLSRPISSSLADQLHHALLALVGLGQHGGRRLAEDLLLGESGRFRREVGVFDAALRVGQVGDVVGQVVDRRFEAVLHRTEVGAGRRDRLQRVVEGRQVGGRRRGGVDGQGGGDVGVAGHVVQRDVDNVFSVGAGLDADRGGRTVEQLGAVEFGVRQRVGDLGGELRDFRLDVGLGVGVVGAVQRLDGQFTHTLQHVADFAEAAFGRLRQADAVIGVADALGHALDLCGHRRSDGEAGGVVLGAVDALAGRQALHGGAQRLAGHRRGVGRAQRRGVGSDNSHDIPFPCVDQVAAIRLLAASKGDNGRASEAFRAICDFSGIGRFSGLFTRAR